MNKLIFVLFVMTMLLFVGCGPDESTLLEEDTEIPEEIDEEKVVEKVIEVKEPTEDVLPTETKTTETKTSEAKTETTKETETTATKPVETKTATTTARPLDDYTPPKSIEPKTFLGQIGDINPIKNGIYSGDLKIIDATYKHYDFTSKIFVQRGDRVKFTIGDDDTATVVEKILDERLVKPTTAKKEEEALPIDARLGRIKSVIRNVNGGYNGKVIDAQTGDEYRYEDQSEYNINQFVYFTIPKLSTENAKIIRAG